ncbi:TraR/DksA family transcriptional regulator [bacterium]|nr:TraR/DksA family transcriptional regulator [bacterium]
MRKSDLESFRKILLLHRARLSNDVSQLSDEALKHSRQETSGDLSSMPIHMADIGSDNFEQEFTLSLMENGEEVMIEIDAALARIEDGTYGVCEQCAQDPRRAGKPAAMVPKERLRAIPWTRHCVEHARLAEEKQ